MAKDDTHDQDPREREFEEVVAAALKVDPKGLSGKHRKEIPEPTNEELDS